MKLVINIVLIVIIALCTWHGYRRGLVAGVAGLIAIAIAIFGAKLVSTAYSGEVVPVIEPFVNGYIDSQNTRDKILDRMGYGQSDLSLEDILTMDSSLKYDYAYECMREVGFYEKHAEVLAKKSVSLASADGTGMTVAIVTVLAESICYVGALVLAFLLILILLIALGNLINLSFRLPNMELADEMCGAVLGLAKSMVYCALLCWLLGFFGVILGKETLGGTAIAKFFLSFGFITKGLL